MPTTVQDFSFASLGLSMMFGFFSGSANYFLSGDGMSALVFNAANTAAGWFFASEESIFQYGLQREQAVRP